MSSACQDTSLSQNKNVQHPSLLECDIIVIMSAVHNVSKDCCAFTFEDQAVFLACLTLADEGTTIFENNGNYLPNNIL
jgi:hypothetical protein